MVNHLWSRNQKLLLGGLIAALLGVGINWYQVTQLSHQQIVINQDLNEVRGKIAQFGEITANVSKFGTIEILDEEGNPGMCLYANSTHAVEMGGRCPTKIFNNGTGICINNC